MQAALTSFKAPEFSVDNSYDELHASLGTKDQKQNWLKPLLRAAAILAICFSVYYYTTTLDSKFDTQIANRENIELPDDSQVVLNSNSTLTFNERNWTDNREVKLSGEAFFKVAKGKKFDVITESGTVSVLGTEFNVKQRQNYFEVACFEGLVAVRMDEEFVKLHPGENIKNNRWEVTC